MGPAELDGVVRRIRAVPGVIEAEPVVESQALVQGPQGAAGAVVRGVRPADLRSTAIIARNVTAGSLAGFGAGEDGGDEVLVGEELARTLGLSPGDPITIISPSAAATALGEMPVSKPYDVAGLFQVGMSEYDRAFVYMPLTQGAGSQGSARRRRWPWRGGHRLDREE